MPIQIISEVGSYAKFNGDIPVITGSVFASLGSVDIQIGAVEIKDAESSERVLVQGSRLQTNALGSSYLLGTGSVQITNTPSVSGAGVFSVIGSQAITNVPTVSGAGTFSTLGSQAISNIPTVSGGGTFIVLGSTFNTAPSLGSSYLLGIGSFREVETVPNDTARTNARTDFTYDSSNRIASIFEIIGTASYFQVFTWSGNGNVLTIGSVRT